MHAYGYRIRQIDIFCADCIYEAMNADDVTMCAVAQLFYVPLGSAMVVHGFDGSALEISPNTMEHWRATFERFNQTFG